MGEFSSFQSIECRYFFIPIYQGAGIKLKTLEAFRNCRYVMGTKEAFLGFPPNSINNISHKLTSLESLALCKFTPKGTIKDFQEAFDLLSNYFINISDVNFYAD